MDRLWRFLGLKSRSTSSTETIKHTPNVLQKQKTDVKQKSEIKWRDSDYYSTPEDEPTSEVQIMSLPREQYQVKSTEVVKLDTDYTKRKSELQDLKQENEILRDKVNTIQIQLNENEVKLKEVVNNFEALEEEKKNFEDKIKVLEKEIESAKEENRELKACLIRLEEKSRKVQLELQQEVNQLKEVPRLDSVTDALLHLGQVCTEIQTAMYKHVLPELYNPKFSYKIPQLLDDIKENEDAESRWLVLQSRINWNKDLGRAMRNLYRSRNQEAHPAPVNETALPKYVEVLDKEEYFSGNPSLADVNRLIAIWKQLKQDEVFTL